MDALARDVGGGLSAAAQRYASGSDRRRRAAAARAVDGTSGRDRSGAPRGGAVDPAVGGTAGFGAPRPAMMGGFPGWGTAVAVPAAPPAAPRERSPSAGRRDAAASPADVAAGGGRRAPSPRPAAGVATPQQGLAWGLDPAAAAADAARQPRQTVVRPQIGTVIRPSSPRGGGGRGVAAGAPPQGRAEEAISPAKAEFMEEVRRLLDRIDMGSVWETPINIIINPLRTLGGLTLTDVLGEEKALRIANGWVYEQDNRRLIYNHLVSIVDVNTRGFTPARLTEIRDQISAARAAAEEARRAVQRDRGGGGGETFEDELARVMEEARGMTARRTTHVMTYKFGALRGQDLRATVPADRLDYVDKLVMGWVNRKSDYNPLGEITGIVEGPSRRRSPDRGAAAAAGVPPTPRGGGGAGEPGVIPDVGTLWNGDLMGLMVWVQRAHTVDGGPSKSTFIMDTPIRALGGHTVRSLIVEDRAQRAAKNTVAEWLGAEGKPDGDARLASMARLDGEIRDLAARAEVGRGGGGGGAVVAPDPAAPPPPPPARQGWGVWGAGLVGAAAAAAAATARRMVGGGGAAVPPPADIDRDALRDELVTALRGVSPPGRVDKILSTNLDALRGQTLTSVGADSKAVAHWVKIYDARKRDYDSTRDNVLAGIVTHAADAIEGRGARRRSPTPDRDGGGGGRGGRR